MLTIITLKL